MGSRAARSASEVVDDVVARVRTLSEDGSDTAAVKAMVAALRAADVLTAFATEVIARLAPNGGIERATGLPVELMLTLAARRPGWDARALTQTASAMRTMPATRQRFARGDLSAAEVRAISATVTRLDAAGREHVDRVVDTARAAEVDPDILLERVADETFRQREELLLAREDRAVERSFLSLQPRLDGLGGSFYGEADAVSFATICETVDVFASSPANGDEDDQRSRARQRLDGLVAACETALSGGGSSRPRARFTVALDAGDPGAARLLWRARGRPGRLSRSQMEALLCDAETRFITFDRGRPITVGDIHATVSAKARAALVARDVGCRFPGCSMPAAWADAHHIRGRARGATRSIDELALLCRRCHRRVHRHRWTIRVGTDGTMGFGHRGKTYTSHPRGYRPARE